MKNKKILIFFLLLIFSVGILFAQGIKEEGLKNPEIIILNMADTHSAYDVYPSLLETTKNIKENNPESKLLILMNGDLLEKGSIVAKKSEGLIDNEFIKRLGNYGQVIINLGNHEFDLTGPKKFIDSCRDVNANVIGNVVVGGMYKVPEYFDIKVKDKVFRIVGIGTNQKNTYPKDLRNNLILKDPKDYINNNYEKFSQGADYLIILSHAGLKADLEILDIIKVKENILFMVGGHDHINVKENIGDIPYMHNGFKGENLNITKIYLKDDENIITFRNILTKNLKDKDFDFEKYIKEVEKQYLTTQDLEIIGKVKKDMSMEESALWATKTLRDKVGADVAFLNHTSFGTGLKKGVLPRYLFDQFMRFDNKVMVAEVSPDTLRKILSISNQQNFENVYDRSGDFLYTNGIEVEDGRSYTIVTSSWVALDFNQKRYFGTNIEFKQVPDVTTKNILIEAMQD